MGKTIEQRLDKIIMDMDNSGYYDMREMAAIIADCNETLKALKALVNHNIDSEHGGWFCFGCRSDRHYHTPDTCPVAAGEVAIAKMEGTDV